MNLIEKRMNLFNVDKKYYFAQCISADAGTDYRSMGMGIAIQFNKKYNIKNKLIRYSKSNVINIGDAILIDNVFNLITKSKYYGKPTYKSLTITLNNMKSQIINNNIHYLAIYRLSCSLDKLQWGKVRSIITDVFNDVEIEILVCRL